MSKNLIEIAEKNFTESKNILKDIREMINKNIREGPAAVAAAAGHEEAEAMAKSLEEAAKATDAEKIALVKQVESLKEGEGKLREEMAKTLNKADKAANAKKAMENRISELESKLTSIDGDKSGQADALATADSNVSKLQKMLAAEAKAKAEAEAKAEVAEAKAEAAEAKAEAAEAKAEAAEAKAEAAEAAEAQKALLVGDLNTKLNSANIALEQAKTSANSDKAQVKQLKNEVTQLTRARAVEDARPGLYPAKVEDRPLPRGVLDTWKVSENNLQGASGGSLRAFADLRRGTSGPRLPGASGTPYRTFEHLPGASGGSFRAREDMLRLSRGGPAAVPPMLPRRSPSATYRGGGGRGGTLGSSAKKKSQKSQMKKRNHNNSKKNKNK